MILSCHCRCVVEFADVTAAATVAVTVAAAVAVIAAALAAAAVQNSNQWQHKEDSTQKQQ